MRFVLLKHLAIIFALFAAGCGREKAGDDVQPTYGQRGATTSPQSYCFCTVPASTPAKILNRYESLVEVLSAAFQANHLTPIKLQVARDRDDFVQRLTTKEVSFALVSGVMAMQATAQDYHVIAKLKGDNSFCGIVLVPSASPIHSIQDLSQKRISFAARTVMAGSMMNRMLLHDHGLERGRDYSAIYCESYDSAVLTLASGRSDAAAIGSAAWTQMEDDRPDLAKLLTERFRTKPMVQLAVIAAAGIDPAAVSVVKSTLLNLNSTSAGRTALAAQHADGYESADDQTYLPARQFLTEYQRLFGDD